VPDDAFASSEFPSAVPHDCALGGMMSHSWYVDVVLSWEGLVLLCNLNWDLQEGKEEEEEEQEKNSNQQTKRLVLIRACSLSVAPRNK
jgi:hypothetical protein